MPDDICNIRTIYSVEHEIRLEIQEKICMKIERLFDTKA